LEEINIPLSPALSPKVIKGAELLQKKLYSNNWEEILKYI
jgi:hypothetical protein